MVSSILRKILSLSFFFIAATLSAYVFPSTSHALGTEIMLSWQPPSTSIPIYGYVVYYGPASRNYTTSMSVSSQTSVSIYDDFVEGQRYYFAVTALDYDGNESPLSSEASIMMLFDAPVSDFSSTIFSGDAPLIVRFSDLSQHAPSTWFWNFGDGTTSTLANPAHIYENSGVYTVTLTVTNALGSDTYTQTAMIDAAECFNAPVRVDSFEYYSLQDAYDDAFDGDIVRSHGTKFAEHIIMDQDKIITMAGGYDCEYTDSFPGTRINGTVTISDGTLIVNNLIIQ